MPGPPSSDPAAWRWRGAWWVEGQGNWSALWVLSRKNYVRRDAEPHRAHHTHSPTRHPLLAVSGAPTAQRVPALDVMGPAPQRMTAESTSERSSGRGTARRLHAGPLTVSSAHGKASVCGHGSSRGQVSLWSWSLEGLEAWTSESQRKAGVRGRKAGDWTSKSERAGLIPLGLGKKEEALGSRLVTTLCPPHHHHQGRLAVSCRCSPLMTGLASAILC